MEKMLKSAKTMSAAPTKELPFPHLRIVFHQWLLNPAAGESDKSWAALHRASCGNKISLAELAMKRRHLFQSTRSYWICFEFSLYSLDLASVCYPVKTTDACFIPVVDLCSTRSYLCWHDLTLPCLHPPMRLFVIKIQSDHETCFSTY